MKNHVFLRGGMGNQFFQWLYAMTLATTRDSVVLNTSFLRKVSGNQGSGKLELESVLTNLQLPLYHTPQIWRIERIFTRLARLLGLLHTDTSLPPKNPRRACYHYGYYQHPAQLNAAMISHAKLLIQHSLRTNPFNLNRYAAIHIRGGDYRNSNYNRKKIGLLDQVYYEQVFDLLTKKHPGLTWLVVSDDYAWARKIMISQDPKKMTYLDTLLTGQETPITAFQALLNADVLCCANSSFSAMAGYLGNASAIYTPAPWFRSQSLVHLNPALSHWHTVAAHF
jgi:hypothetical protein